MPITLPQIDDRRYRELLEEALARIPVHTPEWTNFNRSDPGVTIVEIFAFLTESLLYRASLIPERNRKKFLKLLGIGLRPPAAARGLVQVHDNKGTLAVQILDPESRLTANQISFHTTRGLEVLPVEGRLYVKRSVEGTLEVLQYYKDLYSTFRVAAPPIEPKLYEAQPFPSANRESVALSETVDRALWLALFARESDDLNGARDAIGGRVLTLGFVPVLVDAAQVLAPGIRFGAELRDVFIVEAPRIDSALLLPSDRVPRYRALRTQTDADILSIPGVLDVVLPPKEELHLWEDVDPLEGGTDEFPPSLDDPKLNSRLISWLRIRPAASADVRLKWAGINCVPIEQRLRVFSEVLADGTGEPDQRVQLAVAPVVPGSVRITSRNSNGQTRDWREIDDLLKAGPEVVTSDSGMPAGSDPYVFLLNAESGEVRFGDGVRGARPRPGVALRATYDHSLGAAGNVGVEQVKKIVEAGFEDYSAQNPVPTWGGADAETVEEGEKQISWRLKHRDRAVTAEDFESIALRTPGVSIARVEVLPNFHPDLPENLPGDVPGVVTLMVIPMQDPDQPDAPRPDRLFLSTICEYLDARRLITTEIFVRGPIYRGIWVSIGIKSESGRNEAHVRDAVKKAIARFLAPTPERREERAGAQQRSGAPPALPEDARIMVGKQQIGDGNRGWPLRKPVIGLELTAVAGRVPGVEFVQEALVAAGDEEDRGQPIRMKGLELPRLLGVSVTVGAATPLDQLRGTSVVPEEPARGPRVVQIPAIPEVCR